MIELPSGWVSAKLKDVVELRTGPFGSSLHQSDYVDGGIPIVNPMHIEDGRIRPSQKHRVSEETADRLSEFRLQEGDIVLGRRGEMGRCAVVRANQAGWLCGTGSLIVRSGQCIDPDFLQGLLSSDSVIKYLMAESVGSTMVNLNQRILLDLDLIVPPRAEQARIVEKLEELLSDLDAGVAELNAAQRKLAQYRQSLLKAAVEGALTADWRDAHGKPKESGAELLQRILNERRARWEQKQLAKFAEQGKAPLKGWQAKYPDIVVPDLAHLPQLPESWAWASVEQVAADEAYALAIGPFGSNLVVADYRSDGVPLVFVRNIRSREFGGHSTKYVTEAKAEGLRAHHVAAGDVLVTKMGEPPGDAAVYPAGQPTAVITADCIKIRPQLGLIEAEYLCAVINSPLGIQQIKPMTQGVAQKKVSLGRFSTFAVPIPPVEEQGTIALFLGTAFEAIQEQERAIEHGLALASAQRKNLLKTAFSGQLVEQDASDEPASELLARIRAARASNESSAPRRRRKTA